MDYGRECYDRYINGDDSALTELMDMYCDGLMLYINSIVHDINLAEEIQRVLSAGFGEIAALIPQKGISPIV